SYPAGIWQTSKQLALLRWPPATLSHEVFGHAGIISKRKETLPGTWPAREDHIPGARIAVNEYFLFLEAEFGGQPHGLAAAVAKDFCGALHHIPSASKCIGMVYTIIYHTGPCR